MEKLNTNNKIKNRIVAQTYILNGQIDQAGEMLVLTT